MKLTAVHTGQCEMSARLFILSCKKGYDSHDFIDKLLSSDPVSYTHLTLPTNSRV